MQVIGNDICVDLIRKEKYVTQADICAVLAVWRHLGQILRGGPYYKSLKARFLRGKFHQLYF